MIKAKHEVNSIGFEIPRMCKARVMKQEVICMNKDLILTASAIECPYSLEQVVTDKVEGISIFNNTYKVQVQMN